MPNNTFENIVEQAIEGNVNRRDAEALCAAESIQLNDLYNRLALFVAQSFDVSAMSYQDADTAMNAINCMMVEDASRKGDGFEFAEPALSVYLAFDAGEYNHGDGEDPIEKYTRPQIKELIKNA